MRLIVCVPQVKIWNYFQKIKFKVSDLILSDEWPITFEVVSLNRVISFACFVFSHSDNDDVIT